MDTIDRLKELIEFSVWISFILVPSLAAIKTNLPQRLHGWGTIIVAVSISIAISVLLVRPTDMLGVLDSIIVSAMTIVISIGGDSYLLRIIRRIKSIPPPPEFPKSEAPTKPDIRVKNDRW